MASEATLKLLLLGEDRSAGRALKGVGDDADRAGKSFINMGALAKAGALAVVAGAALAVKFGFDAAKAAAEDARQQAILAKQLQNSAGATKAQVKQTEDWISAQGKAFGVADDKLRPALANLVVATKDVTKAQGLASLAMDVSTAKGIPLEAVSRALAKGYNGNAGALGKLGIATKDADGKTKSFAEIQKDLSKQFGGAAQTNADTYAGKMDRLKLMFDEAKESVGEKLLPILTDLADWFIKDGLPVLRDFGNWVNDKIIPAVKDLAEKYLSGLTDGFGNFKSKLKDLQPFLDLVGTIFTNVLLPVLGKAYQIILPAIGFQLGVLAQALGKVGEVGIWLWNNAFQPTLRFIVNGFASLIDMVANVIGKFASIPGAPKWMKDAARDLHDAAGKAHDLADGIKKIPNEKDVKVTISPFIAAPKPKGPIADIMYPKHAVGTRNFAGGMTWVGETGPELVHLPRGSAISTAGESARMGGGVGGDLGTLTIVVQSDSGEVIERKLAKVKRTRGGAALAFA